MPHFFTYTLSYEENHGKHQSVWPKSARRNLFSKCGQLFMGALCWPTVSSGFQLRPQETLATLALQIARFPAPAKFESKPAISDLMW